MVARLRPAESTETTFVGAVHQAVEALSARPGHVASRLGRSFDEPGLWVLVSEWESVGAYRRALSSYDVRMATGELMQFIVDEPTAYDEVPLS